MKTKLFKIIFFLIIISTLFVSSALSSVEPSSLNFGTYGTSLTVTLSYLNIMGYNVEYGIDSKPDWISVSPSGGMMPYIGGHVNAISLLVSVNRTGLTPGQTYSGTVTFWERSASVTSYDNLSVSMRVPDLPVLSVSPDSYNFGESGTTCQFAVQNTGESTLNWSVSEGLSWLSLSSSGGSVAPAGLQYVSAMVNRGGLTPGTYTGTISFTSNGGDKDVPVQMTVADTTPPTGTISINGGATYTDSTSVTLTLSASDSGSGVSKMKFSNDGVVFSSEEDYATSKSWTLTAGEGTKTVYVQYKDNTGNWSGSISDTITLDTTPPSGTISINGGAQYTDSTSVTLTLSASDSSGVSKMKFSNDGVVFSSEEDYAMSKSWMLTAGDETKTVYVQYKDNAGNWSGAISDTIILDTTPPTGIISINGGAAYTNSTSVTLTLSASDSSGVSKMKFSNDGVNWSGEESYAMSKTWALTAGEGLKTVYVQYKDNAGNWSSPPLSINDTIVLDTIPPTGTISINSGDEYTVSTSVTLTLPASDSTSGVSKMQFSNDGVVFSSEEDYATSKSWTVTAGDGEKRVYVQYKDNAGNWSGAIGDTIILDTTAPTGTISINNGTAYTNSTSVTLTLPASDSGGVNKMEFSNDGVSFSSEEDYATSKSWTLTAGEGTKTVYVQYKDNAGNWSASINDTIILDTTPPGGTISINSGDIYANSTSVTLTLSASDSGGVNKMQFSNDGVSFSSEEDYATSKSWTLTAGDGLKTVYVQYKDNAGNWGGLISDTIILDNTLPSGTILIDDGAESTDSTSVTLTLWASDSGSGVSKMQFSNDGVVFSSEEDYATSKSWTLTDGDGTKTVYVQYKDNAGNWGGLISDTIILDTNPDPTPPSGTILINDGDVYTNTTSVTLTLSASDSSGVSKMQFSNDGVVFSSEEDYATSKSWTLTAGDGLKTVYVRYMDSVGNWNDPPGISDTIILDTTPPDGTISIDDGDVYTNSTSVTLTLSASDSSGVSKMQFSNDGVVFSSEEDYATSKSWTLTASDGLKTVYAKYKDNAGNWSVSISDMIILDTTPPTGTISINRGAGYTNSTSVTLTLSASDNNGVSKMKFSNDGVSFSSEEDYATSKSWTLTAGEGTKTVYVRYKDNAGHWGVSISDTIILETTAPTGAISINNGAVYTDSTSVTLTLSAIDSSGVSKMQFSNDGVSFSSEEDYATSKSWALTTGDGLKTVYVQYKDNAGNSSAFISDTIILETTAPTGTILINDGDVYTNSTSITLTLSASDAGSGIREMKFSNDGVVFSSEENYATSKDWTLTTGDGIKTVYVQYKDNAGNWSVSISDTIILDTTPPSGTISINNGDVYTSTTSVTLTLLASDSGSGVGKMQFSNDGVSWSGEENYATSFEDWTLTADDGTKTVYVQYKDNAGNWSTPPLSISDTITLDTIPPTVELKVDKARILPDGEIVGVLPDTAMEAKFSKVMISSSVEQGLKLIAVKDNLNNSINEEVSLNFAWEGSTKTVITPVSELNKNYLYSLKVTDTVTDLAGNTVEGERETIFRTIMDHTKKNVIVKATNEKLMVTLEANALAATLEANAVTVTLEANALPEDGYLIINTDPLNYQLKVNPENINVANEKSITNGWYPIEGCLWEIKVCKGNGDWMEDNFGSEVKISFPYNEDNGVVENALIPLMEETLQAFWLNEEHSNWVRVPGSRVDRENNVVVTGEVPHFSVFGLMGSAVYDLSDAHAYPVPWKPNDGKDETGTEQEGITFTNLSAEGVIKIYSISGELVREYDYKPADGGKWTWDVETSRGEKVFSGVYIYYIKNEQEQKKGRLMIIR